MSEGWQSVPLLVVVIYVALVAPVHVLMLLLQWDYCERAQQSEFLSVSQ